jgi:tetratricopeptide (TPR) repeat protein
MRLFLIEEQPVANLAAAVHDTAGAFHLIADGATGERRRRADVGALVLRVVESCLGREPAHGFLSARAAAEVSRLPRGGERAILRRLLLLADVPVAERSGALLAERSGTALTQRPDAALAGLLVDYACELESTQRLPEADAALALARAMVPGCAEAALHAGRVARRLGDPARALAFYAEARRLDGAEGEIARFASIGEAVVSGDPEGALGPAIRRAVRAGHGEAAAVGLEERARVRRAAGMRRGAIRDLCVAALRFADGIDRGRVAHEMADIAMTTGDLATAREALLLALACGAPSQREHARSRLHTMARNQGDRVGMRRWRSMAGPPALVSLAPSRISGATSAAGPVLARLRERLDAPVPCPA